MSEWTRRSVLRGAATMGVAALARGSARGSALAAWSGLLAEPVGAMKAPPRLQPFPLSAVRLLPGTFRSQAEINDRYLDSLAADRLLHTFRLTAGITSTAAPLGGWEEPTCELRGHFAGGHYLSAVALSYATSGNDVLKQRGDGMVSALSACQKANGNGYLSAYPAAQFERLARQQEVWAPFYTLHKIMAGLLDMYVHTGNEEALQVAERMAAWTRAYFEGVGEDQRQRMLRVEYGGMNESLANLYALTGRQEYLDTARLFEQPTFLGPLAARRDELTGLHANTHVPKVIGAARMYEVTGEAHYRDIAAYFLDEVQRARMYATGNMSNGEFWQTPAGQLGGTLSVSNAECCVAYNLMKLDRHVFGWTGEARWMDAYERTLLNSRLGTQNGAGLKQYFFPLKAGYWRAYGSPEDSFWCCTGTGAEEFAKFTDTIYFHGAADALQKTADTVYVNQFLASTLDWKAKGFALRQDTAFPVEQGTRLTITAAPVTPMALAIRVPGWTDDSSSVSLNGRKLEAMAEPGSYVTLRRVWRAGDRVEVSLPMRLTSEPLLGTPATRAALYGPLVLAAELGAGPVDGPAKVIHGRGTEPEGGPKPEAIPQVSFGGSDEGAAWIEVASASEMRFTAQGAKDPLDVRPMYAVTDQKYAVYWDNAAKA